VVYLLADAPKLFIFFFFQKKWVTLQKKSMECIKISAVIITLNEERNIQRCIESVKDIADEILVVDSFSTDDTKKIATSLGVRFIEHAFEGHIQQKNWATAQSEFPYVLSLDADEALSEELKKSIIEVKKNWKADGYCFYRFNCYCGKWIKHGDFYPEKKLRLWDKRKGNWGGINPHDQFEMEAGSVIKRLKGNLLHFVNDNISQHVLQNEKFTTIAAQARFDLGKKPIKLKLIFSPIFTFIRGYILKLGFLDGFYGFVIAVNSAHYTFLKYAKHIELYKFKKQKQNTA